MEIERITVQYGRVWSLGNYNNVKPEVTVTALLQDGDDPLRVQAELQQQAQGHVEAIIDQALEQQGDAPEFYTGPRYDVLVARDAKLVAVIPSGLRGHLPGAWNDLPPVVSRFRHIKALEAVLRYDNCRLIDCADGDLSRLPLLESFRYFKASPERFETGYLLLATADVYRDDLPESWHEYGLSNGPATTLTREAFLDEMERLAYDQGLSILTGFTAEERAALPPLKRLEEERPGPSDDDDEDDDDYYDPDDDDDLYEDEED